MRSIYGLDACGQGPARKLYIPSIDVYSIGKGRIVSFPPN